MPLRYYGGPVQHQPEVHVVFWGKNWNTQNGPQLHEEVMRFYQGLSSSPSGKAFQGILTQYFDETGRVSPTLEKQRLTSFTDETIPAPASVSDAKLQQEAKAVAENPKNKWVLGPDSQFVVIPAPGATYEPEFDHNFCAYHSVVHEATSYWTYTFLSYDGEAPFESGCLSYDGDAAASHSERAGHVLSMDASHEYGESATDPAFSAWLDQQGYEIADICSSGDDKLSNQAWVQGLWDDHQSTCSLADEQPPHVLGLTEAPSGVGEHEATLNATVNAENEGLETRYRFEYGPTTSYGQSSPAQGYVGAGSQPGNQQVHQALAGLTRETTYHYRVTATDSREGHEATTFGEDHTFVPSLWPSAASPPLVGAGQSSFGSALISCSFRPWSCGGASCPSRSSCVAVGTYESLNGEAPMAEVWNSGQWSFQALPVPAQIGEQVAPTGVSVALTGVSCASGGACLAVGYARNAAGLRVPVSERLNAGGGWSASSISPPSGAREAGLQGVSCFSSTECMGVGLSVNSAGAEQPYAALSRGGTWIAEPLNSPEATNAILEGVSCASAGSCIAVGFSENATGVKTALAESWNGAKWSVSPPHAPPAAGNFVLSGVSCVSPRACAAVGTYTTAKGNAGLAERWDGAAWSVQSTMNAGFQEELLGVSCPSVEECTAVGDYDPGARAVALVQTWNGVSWSTQASNVDEAQASELHAVSCVAPSTCAAAGVTGWSAAGNSRSGSVEALAEIRSPGFPLPPGSPPGPTAGANQNGSRASGDTQALGGAKPASAGPGAGAVLAGGVSVLRCKVPGLRGVSLKSARGRLSRAHCALGRVRRPHGPSGDLVIRHQSHSAGASLAANARINVALGSPSHAPARHR